MQRTYIASTFTNFGQCTDVAIVYINVFLFIDTSTPFCSDGIQIDNLQLLCAQTVSLLKHLVWLYVSADDVNISYS